MHDMFIKNLHFKHFAHTCKTNINYRLKTEPVMINCFNVSFQKPDINRCICSSSDQLGFYAENHIFLGQCRECNNAADSCPEEKGLDFIKN